MLDRKYGLDDIVEATRYVETGQKVGNVVISVPTINGRRHGHRARLDRLVRCQATRPSVERYIDGFNRSDHAQILSCLADDIDWTVLRVLPPARQGGL